MPASKVVSSEARAPSGAVLERRSKAEDWRHRPERSGGRSPERGCREATGGEIDLSSRTFIEDMARINGF